MDRDELAALAPSLFRFALRLAGDRDVAEDLAQESLVRALSAKSPLKDARASRVWLFRIAMHCWRDQLRRRRSPVAKPAELPGEIADSTRGAENGLEAREDLERALQALQQLPPRQREVLHLVAVEELSNQEAAEVLGITVEAVKASLSVARQRLRDELDNATSATSPTPEAGADFHE